jgi:YopX protein
MREIKFRAWNSIDKEMIYGVWLSSDGSVIDFEYGNVVGTYPKDKVIPLQYTGLKDRNGTEIYEGDVVLNGGFYKFVVSWNEKKAGFEPFCDWTFIGEYSSIETTNEIEVIGNIYENPELLEVSE